MLFDVMHLSEKYQLAAEPTDCGKAGLYYFYAIEVGLHFVTARDISHVLIHICRNRDEEFNHRWTELNSEIIKLIAVDLLRCVVRNKEPLTVELRNFQRERRPLRIEYIP